MENTKGVVFNIQHYSIHDGPGILTTVFISGCPLQCLWCQNPESQLATPVLFFNAEQCTGCGDCLKECPQNAIECVDGEAKTNRKLCQNSGKCVEVCANEARTIMGKYMTAREVFEDLNTDAIFYKNSNGGITLSGGDPLADSEFAIAILKLCKQAGFHTAVETSGHAKWKTVKNVMEYTDLVLLDLKHMDPKKHKAYTRVSNNLILENAKRFRHDLKKDILIRIPIIPDYNNSEENLYRTANFIAGEIGSDITVHLLPFHRLGEIKYNRLGKPDKIVAVQPPDDAYVNGLKRIFENNGLNTVIGG